MQLYFLLMKNFWKSLKKPIFVLAPMYDVTDAAFRRIIARHGKPDVFWTEFVSTDGLSDERGYERLKAHLLYSPEEKPIVAQIFGAHPENYTKTAKLIDSLGFDGIDINMGCPDKAVLKQGSCAALFKNPSLAQAVIRATKEGAPNLPVSVKIRIGDSKIDWQNWISTLLEEKPQAITIHLRTRKEMSKVPAHWELMPDIVKFIHDNTNIDQRPIILGNGDVKNLTEAREKVELTGCDGVMIGRGIFGNPWLFNQDSSKPDKHQLLQTLLEHVELFNSLLGHEKKFEVMKKHFKAYVNGYSNAAELREELYNCRSAEEVKEVIKNHLKT